MALKDKRRADRRSAVHTQTPFWVKSAEFSVADGESNADVVLFSFPKSTALTPPVFAVHGFVTQITEEFDGDASFVAGSGTIPNETDGASASVTAVDADYYAISTDVTEATKGFYPQVGSQFATDLGIGKMNLITGADTTTPVIYGKLTQTTSTKGKMRILALISRVD